MTGRSCGIGSRTSNFSIGIGTPAGARLIAAKDGSPTLLCAVVWDAEGGAPLFGRAAITASVGRDEGRLMRRPKSTLGFALIAGKTRAGSRVLSFRQVQGSFFGHLRALLDPATGGSVRHVVPGRPVRFLDGYAAVHRGQALVMTVEAVKIALSGGQAARPVLREPAGAATQRFGARPPRPP
ncbi:MAG: hypothetical protein IOC92_14235 [Rhodobacter sp.]|nr:hypothetical protein [Rhodobacter sp.]MCA3456435.1 hypothetical protein [Rhodobacter sp.]MCA3461401.1 hypothetical protein [Rhodobacter sp.]MCA3464776.1 hypothetical protein [Rhodobacter sp.]MCA3467749.1 hypothetical protein [Rhodobacter sp.]